MFQRRKTPSNAHLNTNPTPSAATAAAQAFIANQKSTGTLSSAAAAAALRSHTTSPTPVGDVQTKRTLRRQGSTSSIGSAPGSLRGSPKPGVQRQLSAGSMSGRSFRSTSPGRQGSGSPHDNLDPPPVPALPRSFAEQSGPTGKTGKGHRRAASLETPQRVTSPGPVKSSGRGISLDRGASNAGMDAGRPVAYPGSQLSEIPEDGFEGGRRGSINYSYPLNGANSPPPSPSNPRKSEREAEELLKRSPVEAAEAEGTQQRIQDTSNKPVKKKKKKVASQGSGDPTPLADRTPGGRPHGTAVETTTQPINPTPEEPQAPAPKKKKKAKAKAQAPVTPPSEASTTSMTSGQSTPEVIKQTASKSSPLSSKQPPVREEPNLGKQAISQNRELKRAEEHVERKAEESLAPREGAHNAHSRTLSSSPSRSTRFSLDTPSQSRDQPRHQPPPRSLSPGKSAMKQSPSPRNSSPADRHLDIHERVPRGSRGPSSEVSDVSTHSEIGSEVSTTAKKKKNVRVSFDEEAVQVHEAADPPDSPISPQVLSPQHRDTKKKLWLGLGRWKGNVNTEEASSEDEMNDVLKPRPALPSFGSVRGPKPREEGLDQVQKVTENVPQTAPNTENAPQEASSDHALGSVLSEAHSTSHDTAPLPPEVTSVEGSGYVSDSTSAASSIAEQVDTSSTEEQASPKSNVSNRPATPPPPVTSVNSESAKALEKETTGTTESTQQVEVPTIQLVQPTPTFEKPEPKNEWLAIPGGFPVNFDTSDDESVQRSNMKEMVPSEVRQSMVEVPHPAKAVEESKEREAKNADFEAALRSRDPAPEDSSDTGSSIYSDAAEDASDFGGDDGAFASIDAIMESPVVATAPKPQPRATELQEHAVKIDKKKKKKKRAEPTTSAPAPVPAPDLAELSDTAQPPNGRPHEQEKRTAAPSSEALPPRNPQRERGPAAKKKAPPKPEAKPLKPVLKQSPPSVPSAASQPQHARKMSATSALSGTSQATRERPQPLSRIKSNDSDSDASASSFRKERARRPKSDGFGLRRTMRGAPEASAGAGGPTSLDETRRMSLRSMSPTDSARGSPQAHTMRTSMRNSVATTTPSLRSVPPAAPPPSKDRGKSPSRFGFGKAKKSKTEPLPSKAPRSKFTSRFDDSSSDDEGGGGARAARLFQSRFEDSSDEDEGPAKTKLTPVRGIPRRAGADDEGDSTDLPDSSEDESRTAIRPGSSKKDKRQGASQNSKAASERPALAAGSLRRSGSGRDLSKTQENTTTKKRSFFGNLGRRKQDNASKVHKLDGDSVARRDTPLERTRMELLQSSSAPSSPATASSPRPRLIKRMSGPRRTFSGPLSPPAEEPELETLEKDGRPSTSDGPRPISGAAIRPDLGIRRATTPAPGEEPLSVITEINGGPDVATGKEKKKRFPKLRKAFGLKD